MSDRGQSSGPSDASGRLWLRGALIASLGINLFFAGWWVGDALNRRPPPPPFGQFQTLLARVEGKLSAEGATRVRALVAELESRHGPGGPGGPPPISPNRLYAVVVAPDFDKAAFLQVIESFHTARLARDRDLDRRIAEVLATLAIADRRVLADAVMQLPPPPPPR